MSTLLEELETMGIKAAAAPHSSPVDAAMEGARIALEAALADDCGEQGHRVLTRLLSELEGGR